MLSAVTTQWWLSGELRDTEWVSLSEVGVTQKDDEDALWAYSKESHSPASHSCL